MPDREIDPLSRVLGGIENELKSISRTQSEDRLAAARYRTDIRSEIREVNKTFQVMQDDVQSVQSDMRSSAEKISEMIPAVRTLQNNALLSKGALNLAVILGKIAHVASAMIGALSVLLFQKWLGK